MVSATTKKIRKMASRKRNSKHIDTCRHDDTKDVCFTCDHLHYVKSDDDVISNSQICDVDGFFIVKTSHRCREWTKRESDERHTHLLDSRNLDSRELMAYSNHMA